MYTKVVGKGCRIYGDLHISDKYTGRHKNYLANCFDVLSKIIDDVEKNKPAFVVLLGDIVGLRERNIKSRAVLMEVCNFFKVLNKATNGNVFVVRGNHDFGDFPEYEFLSGLGLFKTSTICGGYFDYYGTEDSIVPEARFHLVDYGREKEPIHLLDNGESSNVILAHNNFTISGLTNWYQEHDGIELRFQENWAGVDFVVAGHIHNPSPAPYATQIMGTEKECVLFYAGCPTRPSYEKNLYKHVWVVYFEYVGGYTDWGYDVFELPAIEDTFYVGETYVEDLTEEEKIEIERKADLKDVLDEIIGCRIGANDLIAQVNAIPNASDDAKEIATRYLQSVMDELI